MQIWLQPDYKSAMQYAALLIDEYANKYPKAIAVLEEGLEDSLQYYSFSRIDHRKISSTIVLERLNKEIRRRTKVVGIFPSLDSYIRLVSCYMIEYAEDWESGRCYIHKSIIQNILEQKKG